MTLTKAETNRPIPAQPDKSVAWDEDFVEDFDEDFDDEDFDDEEDDEDDEDDE